MACWLAKCVESGQRTMATLVAVVSDLHCGTTRGLMPPAFMTDDGIEIRASRYQSAAYEAWLDFWNIVKLRKGQRRLWVIVLGDLCDIELFGAGGSQRLSGNNADAVKLTEIVMNMPLSMAERWFFVRGTEAHCGAGSYLEELAAKALGATPDDETGNYSWRWLPLQVDGVTMDLAHHPATYGSRWWTKHVAVTREAQIIALNYIDRNERVPDLALRGHYHYAGDSGQIIRPRALFVPSWALPTAYNLRRAASEIREMGGWVIECEAGRYTAEFLRYQPKRRAAWTEH